MRTLIDTDVLLDVALVREPQAQASAPDARPFLEPLLRVVEVAPVSGDYARRALQLPMSDIDDAFQAAAALAWGADVIVTRNLADYRQSPVGALTLTAFMKRVGA